MVVRIAAGVLRLLLCIGLIGQPLPAFADSLCTQDSCQDSARGRHREPDGLEGFGTFARSRPTPTPTPFFTPQPTPTPTPFFTPQPTPTSRPGDGGNNGGNGGNNGGNSNSGYNDLFFLNALLQGIIPQILGFNSFGGMFGGGGQFGGFNGGNRPAGPLGQGLFGDINSIDEFLAGSSNRKFKGEECEEEIDASAGLENFETKGAKVITYSSRDANVNIHNDLVNALGSQGGQQFSTRDPNGFLNAVSAAAADQSGQKYVVAIACHGSPGGGLQGGVSSQDITNAIANSGTKDASHILLLQGQCFPCTGTKVGEQLEAKGIKPPHHLRGYLNQNGLQYNTGGYHHSIANFVNQLNNGHTGSGSVGGGGGGGVCTA